MKIKNSFADLHYRNAVESLIGYNQNDKNMKSMFIYIESKWIDS